ncbi:MAG: hypothetical protein M3T55_10080, partial [Pseudomonadota bacterium]|nr:hypothetical protein [Pseudomonadota bacterium]
MRNQTSLILLVAVLGSGMAAGAHATDVCQSPHALAGATVHGPVLEVPDKGSVCLALDQTASTWVKVRLRHPAIPRSVLMAAAFGKNATCV